MSLPLGVSRAAQTIRVREDEFPFTSVTVPEREVRLCDIFQASQGTPGGSAREAAEGAAREQTGEGREHGSGPARGRGGAEGAGASTSPSMSQVGSVFRKITVLPKEAKNVNMPKIVSDRK